MTVVSLSFLRRIGTDVGTHFLTFSARTPTTRMEASLYMHTSCPRTMSAQMDTTLQGNASRAPNALKCPQCGTTCELESNKPIILHILSTGNRVFQQLGQYFAVIGILSVIGVVRFFSF